jgi:ABC-2 type transport system permease protein
MIGLRALVLKGFRLAISYRLNFLGRQMVWIFVALWAYFMGEVFAPKDAAGNVLGTDFFTYTLVGICFQQFLMTGLMIFANNLREEMLMGTLEPLLATPARPGVVLLGGSVYNFVEATWTATMLLAIGAILGADFARANIPVVVLAVVLALAGLAAWGIISASFVIVFKKADPIGWGMYALGHLVSGVFFPIETLPVWVRPLSYAFPLTYALKAVRGALVHGESLWQLRGPFIAMVIYAAILIPISLAIFRLALRRARTTGSLVHY